MTLIGIGDNFPEETWGLYAVGILGVALRCVARIRRLTFSGLQWDDYLIIFATFWYTILCVALNKVASGGGSNFMTAADIKALTPETTADRILGEQWVFVSEHAYNLTLWSLKTCMLAIYFRLANRLSILWFVRGCAVYIAATFVAAELSLFLICRPIEQYWAVPTSNEQCATYYTYEIVQGLLSISGDALMLLTAVPIFVRVNLPTKQKVILTLVFGMGIFIIIADILTKVYCLVPSLVSYVYMRWYFREATVSMLVTSLPLVWSLIREVFPAVDSWIERSTGRYAGTRSSRFRVSGNHLASAGGNQGSSGIHMQKFDRLGSQNKVSVSVNPVERSKDETQEISDDDHSERALRVRHDISFTVEYEQGTANRQPGGGLEQGKP